MKRLYLTMDDRLFEAIKAKADAKGILPSTLVVGNLADLYLKEDFNPKEGETDYESLLRKLFEEAKSWPGDGSFTLADLPSFTESILAAAEKMHTDSTALRARIGKSFNAAVWNGKVEGVRRNQTEDGKLINRLGVATYIRK